MNVLKIIALWLFPLAVIQAQICPDTVKIYMTYEYIGTDIDVSIRVQNFRNISGFQFAIEFDDKVASFESASSQLPDFLPTNYQLINDQIRFLRDNLTLNTLPDDAELIKMRFQINEISSDFRLAFGDLRFMTEFVDDNQEILCYTDASLSIPYNGRTLSGKIMFDANNNCTFDEGEIGLDGWLVELTYLNKRYYRNSDAVGYFEFVVPEGVYSIRIIPKSEIWGACEDIIRTTVTQEDPEMIYFLANTFIDCPRIRTDISTAVLKRCNVNKYTLLVENQGTQSIDNVEIIVEFDDLLSFLQTSANINNSGSGFVTLNIGRLDVYEKDTIEIEFFLSCDAVVGQTHCITARAANAQPCFVPSSWTGADLQITSICDQIDNKVTFLISNIGLGDMLETKRYIVTEDEVIRTAGDVDLDALSVVEVDLPANGSTYRIFVPQTTGYPYLAQTATLALEGCTVNAGDSFSKGFVTVFGESDQDVFIDKFCLESVDVVPSSHIFALPKGYGLKRYINNDTKIEYVIHWTNTTDDVQQNVNLKTFISEDFDIASLQMGSSSHPYTFSFSRDRELIINFSQLELAPDAMGFVKFSINPRLGLQNETRITMSTTVLFDGKISAAPVSTFHTIGQDFVIVSSVDWKGAPLKINYYPNPTQDVLNIDMTAVEFISGKYSIHMPNGLNVSQGLLSNHVNPISLQHLPKGSYVLKIEIGSQDIVHFKIIKL